MIQQEDRVHKMLYSPNDQERDDPGHSKLWVLVTINQTHIMEHG